ncbi:unnamed protein product [Rotaria sp. Silwood2]|nr:unnamed protein product [Rotaria sp. Silwood2]
MYEKHYSGYFQIGKVTELISNMKKKMQEMMEKLILIDDNTDLLKELIKNDTIERKELISFIVNNIHKVHSETKMNCIVAIVVKMCIKHKTLIDIHNQFNSLNNNDESTLQKKNFFRKVFIEISQFIQKSNIEDVDKMFLLDCTRLMGVLLSSSWC